jgi:hypothetical protein
LFNWENKNIKCKLKIKKLKKMEEKFAKKVEKI